MLNMLSKIYAMANGDMCLEEKKSQIEVRSRQVAVCGVTDEGSGKA